MTKELTREQLEKMGIVRITLGANGWIVTRKWHKTSTKRENTPVFEKVIKRSIAERKHRYSEAKYYPFYSFSYNGKAQAITESRLIYAWFYGEVPAGYDVDHIDNDPFNNDLDNLQLLSRRENLAKRFEDNPDASHNQREWLKKH